ncbi:MAG TPA: 50S ribosomal protein L2 [Patescibacteria group bacterium]|nr:50S ribosomal protein L2 [Patescibacteria group bacterium]
MGIKVYKPTTSGRRNSSVLTFQELTSKKPQKALIIQLGRNAGRNSQGKITVRHRGGGVKRFYRMVDFRLEKFDIPAKVATVEYDPYRSAFIALLHYRDGEKRYVIAPEALNVGDTVISSQKKIDAKIGSRMPLGLMPLGTIVHNIELVPGKGGETVRSAGSLATMVAIEEPYVTLKMPSGEIRKVSKNCSATVGRVSNSDWRNVRWGKAGRVRRQGWRPTVRGKAMNPVDHPHGGGEGNHPIGLSHPKTPTGKPALGVKTRQKKKKTNYLITKRRK